MQTRIIFWLGIGWLGSVALPTLKAEDPAALPTFTDIRALIDQHFSAQPRLRTGDIISQSEVRSVFATLDAAGWKVEDRDELTKRILPPSAPLLQILRSTNGTKFMRQVANDKLIYDRLDRISQEPGGQRLLSNLVKLPDGARYAKQKTQPGVPDLIDFLPKGRSGKTRRVKHYDKATKKIYTVSDFNKAIKESYETAQAKLRAVSVLNSSTSL